MKKVVLATRNLGKVEEPERMLKAADIDIQVLGLAEFPDMPDVEETGDTFTENALLKARAVSAFTKLPALADDSGLCVDVLGGKPGIYSARWAGVHGDDKANLEKVLEDFAATGSTNRGAQVVCSVALVFPVGDKNSGLEVTRVGELVGEIVDTPRGTHGFGYDPIFQPLGESRTTAQMPAHEKDEISHRGKALRAITPDLIALL
jgi:XTP/dITP diphosphohydrolase